MQQKYVIENLVSLYNTFEILNDFEDEDLFIFYQEKCYAFLLRFKFLKHIIEI